MVLELEIAVNGHAESQGNTYYELHCALMCSAGQGISTGRAGWVLHRRLADLRKDLYNPVKTELSEKNYRMHFKNAPFARHGGPPGTTARLNAWCQALAQVISSDTLPEAFVFTLLRVLESPVQNPYKALFTASVSNKTLTGEPAAPEIANGLSTSSCELADRTSNDSMGEFSNASGDSRMLCDCVQANDDAGNGLHRSSGETQPDPESAMDANASACASRGQDSTEQKDSVDYIAVSINEDAQSVKEHFMDLTPETDDVFTPSGQDRQHFDDEVVAEDADIEDNEAFLTPASFSHECSLENLTPLSACSTASPATMTSCSASPSKVPRVFGPFESFPHGAPALPGLASFWSLGDVRSFHVRNTGYSKTRQKVVSDFAIYDTVGADAIRCSEKICGILDKLPGSLDAHFDSSEETRWSEAWGMPRMLVINVQLPYKSGNLVGAHPADDAGFSLVSYHVLSSRAAELMTRNAPTPAMQLWRRLVQSGVSTKDGLTFKAIGSVENLAELSLPRVVQQFNSKPVMVTKSASILRQKLPEYIEIDIDVRQWAYPARKALVNFGSMAKNAVVQMGFLVEGKSNDSLPEQILAHFTAHYADIHNVKDKPNL